MSFCLSDSRQSISSRASTQITIIHCNFCFFFSKTDTAVTLLTDQSSVVNFHKQQASNQPIYSESDSPANQDLSPTSINRMYENYDSHSANGNHYQSIKDIESDNNHYMALPYTQMGDAPQNGSATPLGRHAPLMFEPSKDARRGNNFRLSGIRTSAPQRLSPAVLDESDYLSHSQCSSEGCTCGMTSAAECDGATYHIDLCRNTIVAANDSCPSCDKSSCSSANRRSPQRNHRNY